MKRQLTFQEYRGIDLALFALMLVIFEFIIVRVTTSHIFRDQAFTVSLAGAITSIVYMRWGWWGGIHAALSGFLFCFYLSLTTAQSIPIDQYAVYMIGNLLSLAAVPVLKKIGPQRVREGTFSSLAFPLAVILLMQGGRGLVMIALGKGASAALGTFTADSLSILFTLVIVWIARRLDGIYEEQRHYLLRIQEDGKRNDTDQ